MPQTDAYPGKTGIVARIFGAEAATEAATKRGCKLVAFAEVECVAHLPSFAAAAVAATCRMTQITLPFFGCSKRQEARSESVAYNNYDATTLSASAQRGRKREREIEREGEAETDHDPDNRRRHSCKYRQCQCAIHRKFLDALSIQSSSDASSAASSDAGSNRNRDGDKKRKVLVVILLRGRQRNCRRHGTSQDREERERGNRKRGNRGKSERRLRWLRQECVATPDA